MSREDAHLTTTVDATASDPGSQGDDQPDSRGQRLRNNVKRLREERLLSKAELARKAGLSALTIDRVESGMPCRMNTKRKIILALGMTVAEKDRVFAPGDDTAESGDDQGSE